MRAFLRTSDQPSGSSQPRRRRSSSWAAWAIAARCSEVGRGKGKVSKQVVGRVAEARLDFAELRAHAACPHLMDAGVEDAEGVVVVAGHRNDCAVRKRVGRSPHEEAVLRHARRHDEAL